MTSYPPIAYPMLLESLDSSTHLLRKYSHSLSAINFSHFLYFFTQLVFGGYSHSGGLGSMMWLAPFSIKNLNSKVGREHKNCSVKSV